MNYVPLAATKDAEHVLQHVVGHTIGGEFGGLGRMEVGKRF